MTWNEFKKVVDKELRDNKKTGDTEIWIDSWVQGFHVPADLTATYWEDTFMNLATGITVHVETT